MSSRLRGESGQLRGRELEWSADAAAHGAGRHGDLGGAAERRDRPDRGLRGGAAGILNKQSMMPRHVLYYVILYQRYIIILYYIILYYVIIHNDAI